MHNKLHYYEPAKLEMDKTLDSPQGARLKTAPTEMQLAQKLSRSIAKPNALALGCFASLVCPTLVCQKKDLTKYVSVVYY